MIDFPVEWSGVAVLALIDAWWAHRIGFSLTVASADGLTLMIALVAAVLLRLVLRQNRGSLAAEFFALSAAATTVFGILSYLCCAVANPLVDDRLLALDRALGFDWLFWFRLIAAHPAAERVLRLAYASLVYQGLYATVLFGLMGAKDRLRELFWIIFVASVLTVAGSVVVPALGAYDAFGLRHLSDYIPDMEKLRAGGDLHFELGNLTGIVTFPSFHTTMALVYCYGFRGTKSIALLALALNMVMLPAIPFNGGHYLVDMIGGAAVAAAAILIARGVHARRLAAGTPAGLALAATGDRRSS